MEIFVSVVLGAGVVGLIVAVAGPFIVDWIRAGVEEQGLEGFWLPILLVLLLALALIGVLVLLAISFISPKWRKRVWVAPAVWLWDSRPVTVRGLRRRSTAVALVDDVGDDDTEPITRAEVQRLLEEAEENWRRPTVFARLGGPVAQGGPDLDSMTDEERAQLGKTFDELPEEARADYVPSAPRPDPRFFIRPPEGSPHEMNQWTLENRIARSYARNVRIEQGRNGHFAFNDGAFWDDLSGQKSGTFEGRIVRADSDGDIQLVLTYVDGANSTEIVYFWIRGDSTDPVEGFPDRSVTL